ncbi:MAG: hypothetical protein JWO46_1811 [Nocardioidaceae bacterium]|nr:hypothetical protein [Nocardioidaceae bacterium]
MTAAKGGVLKYTVVRVHPDTMIATPLLEGTQVPDWAKDLVHSDDLVAEAQSDEKSGYAAQKVDELKAEIEKRNEVREDDALITPQGTTKADLIAALEADDQAQA